ncbi:MAG: adenosylmethionine decarboxylase [Thermoplasmata archaeon]|nr:adenosylmethionine decarboxylase [Thermoplasmata archaeon]
MKRLGTHIIAEMFDVQGDLNTVELENTLVEAAKRSGATILAHASHQFDPQGVSAMVIIAESHLSIHTWPEYNYAAVDIFTCGDDVDPYKALDYLKEVLSPGKISVMEINRGLLP